MTAHKRLNKDNTVTIIDRSRHIDLNHLTDHNIDNSHHIDRRLDQYHLIIIRIDPSEGSHQVDIVGGISEKTHPTGDVGTIHLTGDAGTTRLNGGVEGQMKDHGKTTIKDIGIVITIVALTDTAIEILTLKQKHLELGACLPHNAFKDQQVRTTYAASRVIDSGTYLMNVLQKTNDWLNHSPG